VQPSFLQTRSADGRLALIQAFQKLNICETGNKILVQPLHLFEVLHVPIRSPLHGDARPSARSQPICKQQELFRGSSNS